MQAQLLDDFIDGASLFERGIKLDQGIRPKFAGFQFLIHRLTDALILNVDEALDVLTVIACDVTVGLKNVHFLTGDTHRELPAFLVMDFTHHTGIPDGADPNQLSFPPHTQQSSVEPFAHSCSLQQNDLKAE